MERCTFEITSYDYENPKYSDWKLPYNYHYLYILENGKDVYIGETNDIVKRTRSSFYVVKMKKNYKNP